MLRRHSPQVVAFLFALCAAFSAGCSEGTTHNVAAVPLSVEGSCLWLRGGGNQPQELTVGSRPAAGDLLTTSSAGNADIALIANTLVRVTPATHLRLIGLALTKDGNATGEPMRLREVRVALHSGGIIVSQEEEPGMAAVLRLSVETPHGVATTHFDAVFRIAADEQRTRIVCASGSLSFQPNGGGEASSLKAGSLGEWSSRHGELTTAESNGTAQDELTEALEIVPKIRAVRDDKRNQFPR